MHDQNEQKLWEDILKHFDQHIDILSNDSDKGLDALEKTQNEIVKSIETFFKCYGLTHDRTEIIRTKYLKSQQLFELAKERTQQKITDAVNNSEAHKKYINTKYN